MPPKISGLSMQTFSLRSQTSTAPRVLDLSKSGDSAHLNRELTQKGNKDLFVKTGHETAVHIHFTLEEPGNRSDLMNAIHDQLKESGSELSQTARKELEQTFIKLIEMPKELSGTRESSLSQASQLLKSVQSPFLSEPLPLKTVRAFEVVEGKLELAQQKFQHKDYAGALQLSLIVAKSAESLRKNHSDSGSISSPELHAASIIQDSVDLCEQIAFTSLQAGDFDTALSASTYMAEIGDLSGGKRVKMLAGNLSRAHLAIQSKKGEEALPILKETYEMALSLPDHSRARNNMMKSLENFLLVHRISALSLVPDHVSGSSSLPPLRDEMEHSELPVGKHPSWVKPKPMARFIQHFQHPPKDSSQSILKNKGRTLLDLNTAKGSGLINGGKLLYLGANDDILHPLFTTGASEMDFVSIGSFDEDLGPTLDNRVQTLELGRSIQATLKELISDEYEVVELSMGPHTASIQVRNKENGEPILKVNLHAKTYDEFFVANPDKKFDVMMDKDSWLKPWKEQDEQAVVNEMSSRLSPQGQWMGGFHSEKGSTLQHIDQRFEDQTSDLINDSDRWSTGETIVIRKLRSEPLQLEDEPQLELDPVAQKISDDVLPVLSKLLNVNDLDVQTYRKNLLQEYEGFGLLSFIEKVEDKHITQVATFIKDKISELGEHASLELRSFSVEDITGQIKDYLQTL